MTNNSKNNKHRTTQDTSTNHLFHLQQAFLRQELPTQERWHEVQQQSQCLEQCLHQEQVLWQTSFTNRSTNTNRQQQQNRQNYQHQTNDQHQEQRQEFIALRQSLESYNNNKRYNNNNEPLGWGGRGHTQSSGDETTRERRSRMGDSVDGGNHDSFCFGSNTTAGYPSTSANGNGNFSSMMGSLNNGQQTLNSNDMKEQFKLSSQRPYSSFADYGTARNSNINYYNDSGGNNNSDVAAASVTARTRSYYDGQQQQQLGNNTFHLQKQQLQQHQQQQYYNHYDYLNHASPKESGGVGNQNLLRNTTTIAAAQANQNLSPCPLRLQSDGNTYEMDNSNSLKKRRLISNDLLLLEMLTDTVVSPTTTKKIHAGQSLPGSFMLCNSNNEQTVNGSFSCGEVSNERSGDNHQAAISLMDNRRLQPSSLRPMRALNATMMGNTPMMFTDLFLGTQGCNDGNNGGFDPSALPPSSLVKNTLLDSEEASSEGGAATTRGIKYLTSQTSPRHGGSSLLLDSPLPLPPRRKSPLYGKKKSLGSSSSNGPKDNKDETTTTNTKASSSRTRDTSNHIITPSSATITALSTEIRFKMMQQQASTSLSSIDNTGALATPSSTSASVKMTAQCSSSNPGTIAQFASAIEASQVSQESIHSWDRQFGLRRAHSKTMRETCRSRKRVLDFLKREGANVLLLKNTLIKASNQEDTITPSSRTSSNSTANTAPLAFISQGEEKREHRVAAGIIEERDMMNCAFVHDNAEIKTDEDLDNVILTVSHHPNLSEQQVHQDPMSTSARSRPTRRSSNDEEISRTVTGHREAGGIHTEFPDPFDIQNTKYETGVQESNTGGDTKEEEVQLEKMFRRASLDCVKAISPESPVAGMQIPQEADRKQYYATSA